mgnify:CR=1 FL=1
MIILDHISIEQGAFRMQDVCLDVPRNAYAVLMGATGSGKQRFWRFCAACASLMRGAW